MNIEELMEKLPKNVGVFYDKGTEQFYTIKIVEELKRFRYVQTVEYSLEQNQNETFTQFIQRIVENE